MKTFTLTDFAAQNGSPLPFGVTNRFRYARKPSPARKDENVHANRLSLPRTAVLCRSASRTVPNARKPSQPAKMKTFTQTDFSAQNGKDCRSASRTDSDTHESHRQPAKLKTFTLNRLLCPERQRTAVRRHEPIPIPTKAIASRRQDENVHANRLRCPERQRTPFYYRPSSPSFSRYTWATC